VLLHYLVKYKCEKTNNNRQQACRKIKFSKLPVHPQWSLSPQYLHASVYHSHDFGRSFVFFEKIFLVMCPVLLFAVYLRKLCQNLQRTVFLCAKASIVYSYTTYEATSMVILSWCLSHPSTVPKPDEIETSGFHHMIA